MTQYRMFIGLLFIFLLAGCGGSPGRQEVVEGIRADEKEDESTPESRQVVVNTTIVADGQLAAVRPTQPVGFQSSGRVLDIHVKAGDRVEEGDLIATLDDQLLQEGVKNDELVVEQAENALAQAQLALDKLENWEPNQAAVQAAEANLTAAEANLETALAQDAAAGSSLTSARLSITQAERALNDIQKAYDNAWDEARDWELNYNEPICYQGQGGPIPCTGPTWKDRIENERDATTRGLQQAQESLTLARANYNVSQAGVRDDNALNAEASVANAQQALDQAQTGPTDLDIAAAELQITQAQLSLDQANFSLQKAVDGLMDAQLTAPWDGIVVSVDSAPGALVGAGTPVITLLDSDNLDFHTLNFSERDLAFIGPDQPAEITLKTYPSQPISGTVAYVLPTASGFIGDAATFTVVIEVGESELALWPGMTGRVEIQRLEE